MKRLFARILSSAPSAIQSLFGWAGVALTSYGAWLIYEPAGFITGGLLLLAGALLAGEI